jgi:uncharacterized protein
MKYDRNAFRLNIGFIVNQTIGYLRDFEIAFPELHVPPDLDLSDLAGVVRITRTPQGLLTQVKMSAVVQCECARCLTDFAQPLKIDFTELYAFSAHTASESGLILPEDGIIDLTPLVRDYMLLAIPISPLCRPDCPGLCPICGERLDGNAHAHGEHGPDPRLAKLKELLDQQTGTEAMP